MKKILFYLFLLLYINQIAIGQSYNDSIKSFENDNQTLNVKTCIYTNDSTYTSNNSNEIPITKEDLFRIKGIKIQLIDSSNYFNLEILEFMIVFNHNDSTKELISKSNEFTKEQRIVLSGLLDLKFVNIERIKVKMKDESWRRIAPIRLIIS
jgi:hypothetical protein